MPTFPVTLTDFLKNVSQFCRQTITDFYVRHGLTRAASLAYTTLLAFVPLTIVVMGVVSFFPFFDQMIGKVEDYVFTNFVPHTGDIILDHLRKFQKDAHHLPWISFLFLAITAFMMLSTMETHVNELWNVKRKRFFGLSFLMHWGLLTIGPLLLCASLVMSSYILSIHWFRDRSFGDFPLLLPFICSFLAYVFLYLALPSCKVKLNNALVGAFIAAVGFEVAKIGFAFYANLANYRVLYGALATIPLFLVWLYVASLIFLMGAQITNTLRVTAATRSSPLVEHK